jgi:hypothetical protein
MAGNVVGVAFTEPVPAWLLDAAGDGAYLRPEDKADITLILQMRLRVLPRRGE